MIGQVIPHTEWELKRMGKFTSSRIDVLLTDPQLKEDKAAGKLSATAIKYVNEKAAEIITGTIRQMDKFALDWGNEYEPVAAELILMNYPGMVYHGKDNPAFFQFSQFSGGSPDTVQYSERLVGEIKCPENPAVYVAYCQFRNGEDLKKGERGYYHQLQMNMLCLSAFLQVDFFEMKGLFTAYYPQVLDGFKSLHTIEVLPDREFYEKIFGKISKAEEALADIVSSILITQQIAA